MVKQNKWHFAWLLSLTLVVGSSSFLMAMMVYRDLNVFQIGVIGSVSLLPSLLLHLFITQQMRCEK